MKPKKRTERGYWESLPFRSLLPLVAAIALTFGSTAFLIDLIDTTRRSLAAVISLAIYTGLASAGLILVLFRVRRYAVPAIAAFVLLTAIVTRVTAPARQPGLPPEVQRQIATDAAVTLALVMAGYGLFLMFMLREGLKFFRFEAEMRLAGDIHRGLVPDIEMSLHGCEVCARSVPGAEVGGDLVDAVDGPAGLLCYVADVAGHGVRAGLLTGMVKTVARSAFERGESLEEMFGSLDRVLPSVNRPGVYATCAAVIVREGVSRFALAGHVPILRVRAATGRVERLEFSQFPLGLFPGTQFSSAAVELEPGDLLALVTDGLTDVTDRKGEDYGLDRISAFIAAHASEPLADIRERLFAAVQAHGLQADDQSVLLLRV